MSDVRTIPEITDERLAELAATIKPVIQYADGRYKEMAPVDLKTIAFTWDPKPKWQFARQMEVVAVVETFHDWGYCGLFKPSLAEVYACIQGLDLEGVTHFWLDRGSIQKQGEPFLHRPDEKNPDGYHRADVHLLRGKL